MSQHDYTIANQGFPATRADINNALSAIATNNSGTSAPSTQYAGQFWIDTTTSTWTMYIHDGTDDIQFATIDTSANTVNFIDSALANDVVINTSGDITTTGAFTSVGIDDNATSTAITIDSSENVLVGKTDTTFGNTGVELRNDGRITLTRDGSTPLYLNRLTSDGNIALFYKDGTTVGSIGTAGGDIVVGTGNVGLRFNDTANIIEPWDINSNNSENDTIDLGYSGGKFKDLYLGGGLYVGGTGTANKLDDYEEGTWTPTYVPQSGSFTSITDGSSVEAKYTKIGDVCYVNVFYRTDAITVGSASGSVRIGGLPFTPADGFGSLAVGYSINFSGDNPSGALSRGGGNTEISLYYKTSSNGGSLALNVTDLGTGSNDNNIYIAGFYKVA